MSVLGLPCSAESKGCDCGGMGLIWLPWEDGGKGCKGDAVVEFEGLLREAEAKG